jgi:hypothetical protein
LITRRCDLDWFHYIVVRVMVFSNISVIAWQSVLFMEEARVPR